MSNHFEQLQGEWSLLQERWHVTRQEWQDTVAAQFEREFWEQWEAHLPALLRELDELDDSLDRALRSLS